MSSILSVCARPFFFFFFFLFPLLFPHRTPDKFPIKKRKRPFFPYWPPANCNIYIKIYYSEYAFYTLAFVWNVVRGRAIRWRHRVPRWLPPKWLSLLAVPIAIYFIALVCVFPVVAYHIHVTGGVCSGCSVLHCSVQIGSYDAASPPPSSVCVFCHGEVYH